MGGAGCGLAGAIVSRAISGIAALAAVFWTVEQLMSGMAIGSLLGAIPWFPSKTRDPVCSVPSDVLCAVIAVTTHWRRAAGGANRRLLGNVAVAGTLELFQVGVASCIAVGWADGRPGRLGAALPVFWCEPLFAISAP